MNDVGISEEAYKEFWDNERISEKYMTEFCKKHKLNIKQMYWLIEDYLSYYDDEEVRFIYGIE